MSGMLLAEIAVALLAVVGFYCVVKIGLEWLFFPRNVLVAVEVNTREDADMLDVLLHEAGSASFRKRSRRTVVLISAELLDGTVGFGDSLLEEYRELLDCYGADYYLVSPEEGTASLGT
jgi:hypothetical protein